MSEIPVWMWEALPTLMAFNVVRAIIFNAGKDDWEESIVISIYVGLIVVLFWAVIR